MKKSIKEYIESLNTTTISDARKRAIQPLIEYIIEGKKKEEKVKLNFICTHNSRRSHLSQVWAKTMADYFGVKGIKCYSGGTEATAVYKTVLEVLTTVGFEVTSIPNYQNPTYKVNFMEENCPMTLFSKRHNDAYNPRENFAAVMTCNDADANCPVILNATRLSLPYVDPKVHDNTDHETAGYEERSMQIATEMKYIFSQVKNELT